MRIDQSIIVANITEMHKYFQQNIGKRTRKRSASSNKMGKENVKPRLQMRDEHQNQFEPAREQHRSYMRQESEIFPKPSRKVRDDSVIGWNREVSMFQTEPAPTRRMEGAKNELRKQFDQKRGIRIIQNADKIQVGTIMYSKDGPTAPVVKKFIPVFPFLYDDVGNGQRVSEAELSLPKPSAQVIPLPPPKKPSKMAGQEGAEEEKKMADPDEEERLKAENLPTKLYLRFTMEDDPLFQYEDSRKHSNPSRFNFENSNYLYAISNSYNECASWFIRPHTSPIQTQPT